MSGFYKMDPSAWDFGTANLSLEEEAAYLRIINAIHKHDAPVPNNDRVLAGLFRCSTRKARSLVDALVSAGKVTIEGGVIWNERARSDLVQRGISSASAAERGAKGGKARAKKQAAGAREDIGSQPFHDHFTTISTPEMVANCDRSAGELLHNTLKGNESGQASASSRIEENRIEEREIPSESPAQPALRGVRFEEFWDAWPLAKTGRKRAEVSFNRLSPENRSAAKDRARPWAERWRAMHPTASDIHPATYLNGRRWEDDQTSTPENGSSDDEERRAAEFDRWLSQRSAAGNC